MGGRNRRKQISVILSEDVLKELDEYAREHGLPSRSITIELILKGVLPPLREPKYVSPYPK